MARETHLIKTELFIKDYIHIDIIDSRYEDFDDMRVKMEATFQIDTTPDGLLFEVYEINNISVEYTGKFEDFDTSEFQTFVLDDSWSKDIDFTYPTLDQVIVDVDKKEIRIVFDK